MALKKFIKENFVLVTGITLPVLLMLFFMLSTMIPTAVGEPPQYDLVFSTQDYDYNSPNPLNVNLVVKNGTLVAQYNKNQNSPVYGWRRLFLYEAKTGKVRELTFGLPPDAASLTEMREEAVEATKGMKLDTTLQAPDGYELSYYNYSRSGLFNEFMFGGGRSSEVRLRKGSKSVQLAENGALPYYNYGDVQFIGWVIP